MTALVTPDAVEAAARAMQARDPYCYNDGHAPSWENLSALAKACYSDLATTALAAAAPRIAEQTLLDAAAEFDAEDAHKEGVCDEPWEYATASDFATDAASSWLTARAATLTPKDTP